MHRDLKPENCLLNRDKDPKLTIIDFGTASTFQKGHRYKEKFGTPYYIAPEVLKQNYDYKCDIWSAGVILFILLSGYPPFNASSDEKIVEKVAEGKYSMEEDEWSLISEEAKDLVRKMLTMNPRERISAQDALKHPWIVAKSAQEIDKNISERTLTNLRNFKGASKLKQAALAFIASHLTKDAEKKDSDRIFNLLDTDGNGELTKEKIYQGYVKFFGQSISREQVDKMFDKVDIDGSGAIDYTEFVMATMNEKKLITKDRLRMAF
mmetsp:Transcript_549/g.609  ORF Transcript_549/g.609 Transcript_549/m.609 type:complete len:265 (+) Transcript_549:555-1349(+)